MPTGVTGREPPAMLRILALCLAVVVVLPLTLASSAPAAPKKPAKCPAGSAFPGNGPRVCFKLGPPRASGPQLKGLPRRHAKALKAARKRGPELLALIPRAQELLSRAPASRRARIAAVADGPAQELPVSTLGGKFADARAR